MYQAFVCKIYVRPVPGLDNLVLGECKGYQVLVGKDTQDGQTGIFFEQGGQLSEEFATQNDLVRRRLEDGSPAGGMFEPNRRVKAIKIKGVRSDGFWCPVSSLVYTKFDVRSLKEGDQFNELNDHKICDKYVTSATAKALKSATSSIKVHKELITFPKHIDTGQFIREVNLIPKGAYIMCSSKAHGCLAYNVLISMADGTKKAIIDVKEGDCVLGVDEGHNIVPSTVLQKFDGGKSPGWLNVKVISTSPGNYYSSVVCTSEHWFYNIDKDTYVSACNLVPDDKVLLIKNVLELTYIQKQLLLGKLLGDGTLTIRKASACIEYGHSVKDSDYLDYFNASLGNIVHPAVRHYTSGFGSTILRSRTKDSYLINKSFLKYKVEKGKKFTEDLIKEITPLVLAIWYMDDGSLSHNDFQQDRAMLALCRYTEEECVIFQACFQKFGISTVVFKDKDGYFRLRMNKDAAEIFFTLIREYVPICMERKLPVAHRGKFKPFPIQISSYINILVASKVLEVVPAKIKSQRYDMETEVHNYFANGVLVHNTSHRTAFVYDAVPPDWYYKFEKLYLDKVSKYPKLNRFRNALKSVKNFSVKYFPKRDWIMLVGSRNVVLNNKPKDYVGFYGSEDFRFEINKSIKLHKNEVLFGEIVGYTHTGKAIMNPHDISKLKNKALEKKYGSSMVYKYGNLEGLCKLFVYRIAMTNDDGVLTEYSWDQVEKRCRELGLQTVTVLDRFVYDGDAERLKKYVDKLVNGKTGSEDISAPEDSSHLQEGVVVRADSNYGTQWMKHKSWLFGVLEGYAKDDFNYVDAEEAS